MNRILLKSLLFGFVTGVVCFAIAPLGLGIELIALLKPVLAPGIPITQLILGNNVTLITYVLAVLFNGIIYTALFAVIFLSTSGMKKP